MSNKTNTYYTPERLLQCSTYKLRRLAESPHTKKQDLTLICAELLQRKFGNQGKSLKYIPPQG